MQFIIWYRLCHDACQFGYYSANGRFDLRRVYTRADNEVARFRITVKITSNIIGQTLFLTYRLEQARTHTFAENRIQYEQYVVVG